jgi:5'-methylthioadenosine phosphorylase
MTQSFLGIVGGSGIYEMPGFEDAEWRSVASPWGQPSDAVRVGRIGKTQVAFLPRHGRGHRLSPSDINYRANIDVLKRIGVTDLVSVSAVGSLKEELSPGTFVLVDQFIDRTFARTTSFFGAGCVAHVSMAHPVSPRLFERCAEAAAGEGIGFVRGGTLVVMEGPQFSSLAESRLHRQWGADLIGMTAMPEAKLAREAEMAYATVAMVTDYDAWQPGHDVVDVAAVVRVLNANRDRVQGLVARLARDFPAEHEVCPIGSDRALDNALMTAPEARDPALLAKLDAVTGRVLGKSR